MNLKELKLECEALFSQAVFGHGYLHYGYWKSGEVDEKSLASLGVAQQEYFNQIVNTIPKGTQSILDVGSGISV